MPAVGPAPVGPHAVEQIQGRDYSAAVVAAVLDSGPDRDGETGARGCNRRRRGRPRSAAVGPQHRTDDRPPLEDFRGAGADWDLRYGDEFRSFGIAAWSGPLAGADGGDGKRAGDRWPVDHCGSVVDLSGYP